MRRLLIRKLAVTAGTAVMLPFLATAASAGTSGQTPTIVPDSSLTPTTVALGGAKVLPTTRTVAHWYGTAANPTDGVTYGFNMVGADPSTNQSTTITTDIIPINVVVGGMTFSGTDVLQPTLNSPLFTNNDYTTTPAWTSSAGGFTSGTGALSSASTGSQLEDATMRSQFNKGGTNYHVILNPVVHDAITIDVPANHGTLLESVRGVIAPDINVTWWAAQLQNLNNNLGYMDPTHLPLYLTNNVMLYSGTDPLNCCIIGFHSASEVVGHGLGSTHSSGSAKVQTYAWGSYVTPGFFNPSRDWALQDIHALSHEISEWADDPFVNNTVQPWLTPTAPQYGCTGVMETGDPVVGIGFAKGTNTFEQGPTPNGTQVADGYYHPEDEVLMPWFMRLSPSTSETGRYTFMGNLNPYPGFQVPATGC
ncbi:MAG TPA: hypothetical protein VMU94_00150 [Streptosporangiaceae bacterium]|nr:hypothetical protein [Streptosporangiaceae bacterium]